MPYRKIAVDMKTAAVRRVFQGEMVTAVADDMGIDRNSLSLWVRRAVEAINSNLTRKKRERKHAPKGITSRNVAQIRRLKDRIMRQEKTIAEMRNSLKASVEAPVPEQCPACGCIRFYKNGMGKASLERLLKTQPNAGNQIVPVQKFICVNCGCSTHLEGPPALFHWVAESYRYIDGGEICAHGKRGNGRRRTKK